MKIETKIERKATVSNTNGAQHNPTSELKARLLSRVEVGAFKTGGRLAPLLPPSMALAISGGVRRVLTRQMRPQRFMAERHMRRALGPEASESQIEMAVDEVFASYARYWFETLRLGGLERSRIEESLSVEGFDMYTDALAQGNGCVLALPHLGQWEVAGAWLGIKGYRLTTVAEELEPAELYRWFVDLRERRFGMNVYSASDPDVVTKLVRSLSRGDTVALLSDRDLGRKGPEVMFFGEKTTMPPGPALLAIETGAPLLPAAVYELGDWRYEAIVRPPLEVPKEGTKTEKIVALTQELAYELEGLIRRAPAQWHLLQSNWPSDREAIARLKQRDSA